jgi:hypothetical protein
VGATGDIYYVANSNYHNNLQRLAATLPANASSSPALFAIAAVGASPDTIHTPLHCRGDINTSACRACATGAFEDAQQLCAYNKDATVFYELCVLRYSNQDFLLSTRGTSKDDDFDDIFVLRKSPRIASTPADVFDAAVGVLLNATADSGSPLVHLPPAVAPAAASSGHQKGDQSVACINSYLHNTPLIKLVNMHVDQSIPSVRLCIIPYAALIN